MGEQSNNRRQRAPIQTHTAESAFDQYQNPPDYSTIMTTDLAATSNENQTNPAYNLQNSPSSINQEQINEFGPRILFNSEIYRHQIINPRQVNRRNTTTNFPSQKSLEKIDSFSLTMPRRQTATTPSTLATERCDFRNLTANDVAQLLRSTQHTQITQIIHNNHHIDGFIPTNIDSSTYQIDTDSTINNNNINSSDSGQEQEDFSLTRSVEELVLNEVPPNRSSFIGETNEAATYCDK